MQKVFQLGYRELVFVIFCVDPETLNVVGSDDVQGIGNLFLYVS